jgi:hypothetical protein
MQQIPFKIKEQVSSFVMEVLEFVRKGNVLREKYLWK